MTADSPAKSQREPVPGRSDRAALGLPGPTILSMCDQLLGEAGRRHHMFAWLRAPGAGAGEWLAVDAYYPRARLVVMCRSGNGPYDSIYRETIPAHGLGLLTLDPALLGNDRAAVQATLAGKIFDLEHVPRQRPREKAKARPARRPARAAAPPPREPSPPAENAAAAPPPENAAAAPAPAIPTPAPAPQGATPVPAPPEASARATPNATPGTARREWTPVKVAHTSVPQGFVHGLGLVAGLALAAVLIAEVYLALTKVASGAGRPLLAVAIAIEACSRALGTVAAERAGQRGWAFGCAIGGSPVVAWYALLRPSGRVTTEPAPLAGLLAVLAGAIALLALLTGS